MYTEAQRKAHIWELQALLHGISYYNPAIPRITPDGIYGAETVEAVKAFQQYYGLTPTGETNSATWEKIAEVYQELVETLPQALDAFPAHRVIYPGEHGFSVMITQAILCALSEQYENMPHCAVTGDFDEETMKAVQLFQRTCALPVSGNIDCRTWNMLAQAGNDLL